MKRFATSLFCGVAIAATSENNSFSGIWGNGAETTPPTGRVVGQRALGG